MGEGSSRCGGTHLAVLSIPRVQNVWCCFERIIEHFVLLDDSRPWDVLFTRGSRCGLIRRRLQHTVPGLCSVVNANLRSLWWWFLEPLIISVIHLTAEVYGIGWFSERHGADLLIKWSLRAGKRLRLNRDGCRQCPKRRF